MCEKGEDVQEDPRDEDVQEELQDDPRGEDVQVQEDLGKALLY